MKVNFFRLFLTNWGIYLHLVPRGGLARMPWPSSTRVAEWTHAVERPWHIMPEIHQKSHMHSIRLKMIYDALRM